MGRQYKVEKYGLEEDVRTLWNGGKGLSPHRIAKKIKKDYGHEISHTSISRWLDEDMKHQYDNEYKEGGDPAHDITQEFVGEMRDLANKIEDDWNEYDQLLEEAINERDFKNIHQLRKGQRDDIEQIRKNLVSLIQFANMKFSPLEDLQHQKEEKFRTIIINIFGSMLCDECKQRAMTALRQFD